MCHTVVTDRVARETDVSEILAVGFDLCEAESASVGV